MYHVYKNSEAPVKLVGCPCLSKGSLVERMARPKLTRADSLSILFCILLIILVAMYLKTQSKEPNIVLFVSLLFIKAYMMIVHLYVYDNK